jgi:hypothetical protein
MNRVLVWSLGGALLIGATGLAIVMAEPTKGAALIAGDQPVTEDQVRQKLQSDGWQNVSIVRDGRYLEAIAIAHWRLGTLRTRPPRQIP